MICPIFKLAGSKTTPFVFMPGIILPILVTSTEKEKVEETYIMIKPDGVQRGFVGEVFPGLRRSNVDG